METLSWELFAAHLKVSNPSTLPMGGTRGVRLGFNPPAKRMFIRLPIKVGSTVPPSPYSELALQVLNDETGSVLEVSTSAEKLFREFHRFAGLLAEEYERSGATALGAFQAAIQRWGELTERKALLTQEQLLGLFGELWFLRALLRREGAPAVTAWTGRNKALPERHDFRVGTSDIEIKTTRLSQRRHTVHGLSQLEPILGHDLFILSFRLAGAGIGTGTSVPDLVHAIRKTVRSFGPESVDFESKLQSAGYDDADEIHYGERLSLSDLPVLVEVNRACPRIVREMLAKEVPAEVVGRIEDVSYRINLEGLGTVRGAPAYLRALGDLALEDG